jgi:hypothetical protein
MSDVVERGIIISDEAVAAITHRAVAQGAAELWALTDDELDARLRDVRGRIEEAREKFGKAVRALGEAQFASGFTPASRQGEADQKELLAARLHDVTGAMLTDVLRERNAIFQEKRRRYRAAGMAETARRDAAKEQARKESLAREIESLTRQSIAQRLRGMVAGAVRVGTRYEGIEGADLPSVRG